MPGSPVSSETCLSNLLYNLGMAKEVRKLTEAYAIREYMLIISKQDNSVSFCQWLESNGIKLINVPVHQQYWISS